MKQKVIPHLWFDSQAEDAARFYTSVFDNSRVLRTTHYGQAGSELSGKAKDSVMTVEFEIEGHRFVALNGGPMFRFSPAISFFVACSSVGEVDRLFQELSPNGEVLMPLDSYPFSERYAWINDRYGMSWQLYLGSGRAKISPCLLFVKKHFRKAEEAVRFYVSLFERSQIHTIAYYDRSEGDQEGAVKHASFSLDGSHFIAMDSGLDHAFTFTPAVSFMVECTDQREIDHFWDGLSAVPEAQQCGWLQDKCGISWQIVPADLDDMISNPDHEIAEQMMKTVLGMKKLDINVLRDIYESLHREPVK